MGNTSRELQDTYHEMIEYCGSIGLKIFYGALPTDEKEVYWDYTATDDWRAFLDLAKRCHVPFAYIDRLVFDDAQIDDVRATDGRRDPVSTVNFQREIEQYRIWTGRVALIEVAFLYEGRIHRYYIETEWYHGYRDLTEVPEERGNERRH